MIHINDQVIIQVKLGNGKYVDRDIRDTTVKQRLAYYKTLTRENMYILVEDLYREGC